MYDENVYVKITALFSCNIYLFLCSWHILQVSQQSRHQLCICWYMSIEHMQKLCVKQRIQIIWTCKNWYWKNIVRRLLKSRIGMQAVKLQNWQWIAQKSFDFIVFLSLLFHFCPHSLVLHGKEQRHLAQFLLWCFVSLEKANGDRIFTSPKGSICSSFSLCEILSILKRFN